MHQEMILGAVDRLSPAAIRAVAPIGPSVDKLRVIGRSETSMPIDLPVADAIRSKGELEITDLRRIDLRIDGFVRHSRKLNVENPESAGAFITADVRDPSFEISPNAYTAAAASRSSRSVQAERGYRSGVLERIYIMDCVASNGRSARSHQGGLWHLFAHSRAANSRMSSSDALYGRHLSRQLPVNELSYSVAWRRPVSYEVSNVSKLFYDVA